MNAHDGASDRKRQRDEKEMDDRMRVAAHFRRKEIGLQDTHHRISTFRCKESRREFTFRPYKRKTDKAILPAAIQPKRSSGCIQKRDILLTTTFAKYSQSNNNKLHCLIPRKGRTLSGHSAPICCLQWNPKAEHILLSASADRSIRVWSLSQNFVMDSVNCQEFDLHEKGVACVKWSLDGSHFLSGGFDNLITFNDTATGECVRRISRNNIVYSLAVHPGNPNIFLSGEEGQIVAHDLRASSSSDAYKTQMSPTNERLHKFLYKKTFGSVYDVLFLTSAEVNGCEHQFLSSASTNGRNASNETLLLWDFRSCALLYDRFDNEGFVFPSLRLHPTQSFVAAQCSNNRTQFFSCNRPYKRQKRCFRGGHSVEGYGVQGSFHANGKVFVSGDINGYVYYYKVDTGQLLAKTLVQEQHAACLCAEYHPSSTGPLLLAAAGYDSNIYLLN